MSGINLFPAVLYFIFSALKISAYLIQRIKEENLIKM